MTPQEIFTASVVGIVRQGAPAIERETAEGYENPQCRYHTNDVNGKALYCAVGILLSPEAAKMLSSKSTGGIMSVLDVAANDPTVGVLIPEWVRSNSQLLQELQMAHDEASDFMGTTFVTEFKKAARTIAKRHELQMPEGM